METRQVFSSYDYRKKNSIGSARYCPSCGSECALREVAGRERFTCLKCGFVHYRNPLPAVSVLIADGNKILLGKRSVEGIRPGLWSSPCGFIEHDEDFITAAHREVFEETGLRIEIKGIINVACNFLSADVHSLVVVMLAEPRGGRLIPGDDLVELAWFGPGDELPELAFEADSHMISQYRSNGFGCLPIEAGRKIYDFGSSEE